jgi:hypothetical protein
MNNSRIQKYEDIYYRVGANYEKTCSIPKACKELGICISNYYKICKKIGRPSVASKHYDSTLQTGGDNKLQDNKKNMYNHIIHEQSENSYTGIVERKTSVNETDYEREYKYYEQKYLG